MQALGDGVSDLGCDATVIMSQRGYTGMEAARRVYYRKNRDYELIRGHAYRAAKALGLTTGQVLALWGEPPLRRPGKGGA